MTDDCRSLDALVTPYVDGELSDVDRRAVDAHLAKCPPCHSRVSAERTVREALCVRRRELAATAAPPQLRTACERLRSRQSAVDGRRFIGAIQAPEHSAPEHSALSTQHPAPRGSLGTRLVPFALAASLVVIVGGAFAYQMTDISPTVLAAELTADHIKCFAVNALLHTQQTPSAVEAAMLGGFGWSVHLPLHPEQSNLELVGARRCLYGEGTIAHVMYRHNGQPVSLFMLPKTVRAEQLVEVLGHEAKIWCAGNRTLVLVAREPRRDVERLAEFVQTSLH